MTTKTAAALIVKIVPNETGNPPGKLADAEIHFPQLTDEQRTNLQTIDAITYGASQAGALAVQAAARIALAFDGAKLIGFAIWERRTGSGRNVTFPARQYSINGERRSFALLRPITDATATERIRDLVLDGYAAYEAAQENPARCTAALPWARKPCPNPAAADGGPCEECRAALAEHDTPAAAAASTVTADALF